MKYKHLRFSLLSMLVMLLAGWGSQSASAAAEKWVKTDPASLSSGDQVVIVDLTSAMAMSNDKGTASAPSAVNVTLDGDNSEIIGAVADKVIWDVDVTKDGFKFAKPESTSYLYCTSSNNGLRVGSGARSTFTLVQGGDNNCYYLYNKDGSDNRYIGVYNATDWRCYTSINSNIKGNDIAFFVKTEDASDTRLETSIELLNAPTEGMVGGSSSLPSATIMDGSGNPVTEGGISWSSSNEDVAYVSDGMLYFAGPGTAQITATFEGNTSYLPASESFEVTVLAGVMENIAALTAQTTAGNYQVKVDGAVVTYVDGNYTYIQDASGAVVFFKSGGSGMTAGQVLSGKATVTYQVRNGNPQITSISGIQTEEGQAPAPKEVAADSWSTPIATVLSQYFKVTGATITKDGNKFYTQLGDENVQLYGQGGANPVSVEDLTGTYTIIGFPTIYNTTKELQIFVQPEKEEDPTADATVLENIAALKAYTPTGDEGDEVLLTLTNAKVTFSSADLGRTIIEDASGAYMFEGFADYFTTGQTLNGQLALVVAISPWLGVMTVSDSENTAASVQKMTITNGTAEPKEITEANVDDYVEDYDWRFVKFSEATFTVVPGDYGDEYHVSPTVMGGADLGIQDTFGLLTEAPAADGDKVEATGWVFQYDMSLYGMGVLTLFQPLSITVIKDEPTVPGEAIWTSEEPVAAAWGSDAIKALPEKLANATVGDIIHVVVEGVTPGDDWSAQVAIKDGAWSDLEAGVPVGSGNVTDAQFVITGDILKYIKQNGLQVSGENYSTRLVTLESTENTGSDESVWIGNENGNVTINVNHFKNANDKAGIKAGDIIRVTATAQGTGGDTWMVLSYSGKDTGWSWMNYVGMDGKATDTGFDFVVTEDNISQIHTDGIIINQGGYTITQVELIAAPAEENHLYLIDGSWDRTAMTELTFDEEKGAYVVTVEPTADYNFAFADKQMTQAEADEDPNWDVFNSTYRLAIGEGKVTPELDTEVQLTKVNGTLLLKAGSYTITITKDLKMTVTGTVSGEDAFVVAGAPAGIFGNEWNGTDENNKMEKQEDGTYSKTYDVSEAYSDVQLKVVKNGSEWYGDETGNNVTFNLTGAGTFTVSIDPETNVVTVTGDIVEFSSEFVYESVYVAGNGEAGWLNGESWNSSAETNKMTEVEDGVWEITFTDVPQGENRQLKFTIDGAWTHDFGGTFSAFGEETDAVYKGGNITFNTEEDVQDITVRLDLSGFDFSTKTGATFTITSSGQGDEPAEESEMIKFTEEDVASAGNTDRAFSSEHMKLTITDNNGKVSIDNNNCWFGDAENQIKFSHRLKTGGKSSSNNNLTLNCTTAGTLKIYVRSSSSDANDRNLTLTQGDEILYDKVVQDADAIKVAGLDSSDPEKENSVYPIITVEVAAGDVLIGYPKNGLNFYAFEFIPSDETETGINGVRVSSFDESLPAYNLSGQRVDKTYRGVVIQKGKKFVIK